MSHSSLSSSTDNESNSMSHRQSNTEDTSDCVVYLSKRTQTAQEIIEELEMLNNEKIARPVKNDTYANIDDKSDDDDDFDDEDDNFMCEFSCQSHSMSFEIPNNLLQTCPICFEADRLLTAPCCTFSCCNSCWNGHIAAAVNEGRIKVLCISTVCNKYLTRESITDFIRHDVILHERYSKLYINANQNPRVKTCPRCSHIYSLDTIGNTKSQSIKKIPKQVQCSECSLVWCFRCSAPWHADLTCKQFNKGEKLLLKWIKQKSDDQWNARKCPKCSSLIQRAGGCPHMTCSKCSCEFCYLCGRRYNKIPIIGQHSNKFSIFGCPYNLHPEKPWLRRTIRGSIATGVVVSSPILVVGALTAAVFVLPPVGIYRMYRYVRNNRQARLRLDRLAEMQALQAETHDISQIELNSSTYISTSSSDSTWDDPDETIDSSYPLSIFASMDVENLFSENCEARMNTETQVSLS